MQRISDSSTTFQQVFAPIMVVALSALWFVGAFTIGATEFWIAATALAIVAIVLLSFAPRFRHVEFDDLNVRVSGAFRNAIVPLSSIACVTERTDGHIRTATIEFAHITPFGHRVDFIPRTQIIWTGWLPRRTAPVVQELAKVAHCRYVCKTR